MGPIIEMGDILYKIANPNSTMCVPSMVYEGVESVYKEWVSTNNKLTFKQYVFKKYHIDNPPEWAL